MIGQKKLVDIDSGLELVKHGSDLTSIFDYMLKAKSLTQFGRLFEEKSLFKKSKLNQKIIEFLNDINLNLDKNIHEDTILVETLVLIPFLFRKDSKACSLILNLNKTLTKAIKSNLDENWEELEKKTFLLSFTIWSDIMTNRQENISLSIKEVCELIPNINQLQQSTKLKTSNKYDRVIFDMCDNNLIRALNYYVIIFNNQTLNPDEKNAFQVKSSIENIIDVLKNQLSSPYHEVK